MTDPIPDFGLSEVWQRSPELGQTEYHRRVFCARWNMGNVSKYRHRAWIIERLWDKDTYELNPWSHVRLKGVCQNVFVTWMAGGGTGKTTDAAAFALQYWMEDPANTAVIVCSTTKEMLRRRIWGQICHLWNRLPTWIAHKGDMLDTACMIRWQPNDMKNGIFGVAVDDGPVEEAVNNLIGIHTKRVWLILDEMQGVKEAIMAALPNMVKNPESRFLGMGNPSSIMSMLCKFSEPLGIGWSGVIRGETPHWPISPGPYLGTGRCYFFDGRKSPAILDPEWGAQNPWMISKEQVEHHIATKGENSPEVWTQTIGWPPPLGVDTTVLDVSIIEKFHCRDKAHWTDGFEEGAALDPAFVEGGDKKVLQFVRWGLVNDDAGHRWVIEMGEAMEVPINAVSKEPVEYQIMNFVKEKCKSKGIKPSQFATDSSGIGRGLKMIFDKEWGSCIGVEFSGNPSDMAVDDEGKTAREHFDRRSSELNIMVREFANANGLRGLGKAAEEQFCIRETDKKNGVKHHVETKKEMKKRLGRSPDDADAVCIAVHLARINGAVPGRSGPAIKEAEANRVVDEEFQRQYFSDDNVGNEPDPDYMEMV